RSARNTCLRSQPQRDLPEVRTAVLASAEPRRVVPTSALGVDARAPDHELLPRWSGSSGVIAARRSPGLTVQDPVRIPARALGYPADTRQPDRQGISVRVEQLRLGRLTEPPADHLALEKGGSRAGASVGGSTGSPSQLR